MCGGDGKLWEGFITIVHRTRTACPQSGGLAVAHQNKRKFFLPHSAINSGGQCYGNQKFRSVLNRCMDPAGTANKEHSWNQSFCEKLVELLRGR